MEYQQALDYLDSFINYERAHSVSARDVKLERMRLLCERLGHPERGYRSILVGGTNGKGSICSMLYSMLRQGGFRVGLYTSPHVMDIRERIRFLQGSRDAVVNDTAVGEGADWIAHADFIALLESMQPVLEDLRQNGPYGAPTYFEVLTALAFCYFRRAGVEIAVVEVGMGGRLDATNVLDQAVSVLGPISMDHAAILGDTPALIAAEKAGIIKPGQCVVSAPQQAEVDRVIETAAADNGVFYFRYGKDFSAEIREHSLNRLVVNVKGLRADYSELELPLCGRHQAENLATAIAALEALSETGVPHGMVAEGVERVAWPGRFEIVHEGPRVLLDGAHNDHAVSTLAQTLRELLPETRFHFLLGASSDKDVIPLGEQLGKLGSTVTCCQSRHPRALPAEDLAERLRPYFAQVNIMRELSDAYTYLLNTVDPEECIVVAGSIYLVGELRQALHHAGGRTARTEALI